MNLNKDEIFVHEKAIVDNFYNIGFGTKIWQFSHVNDGVLIGDNCTIGQNVYIGKDVVIGDSCRIQNNVYIPEGVCIGNNVFIAPNVTFTNVKYPISDEKAYAYQKTKICDNIVIGANTTIICGITIENNCFIGAASLITKNIKSYTFCYGNPLKVKGKYDGKNIYYTEKMYNKNKGLFEIKYKTKNGIEWKL